MNVQFITLHKELGIKVLNNEAYFPLTLFSNNYDNVSHNCDDFFHIKFYI